MLKSDGIIGPFHSSLTLSDGTAAPVGIKIRYRAHNPKDWTIVLNRHTQAVLEETLAVAADEFDVEGLKEAADMLTIRLREAMPALRDAYNQHDFSLEEVMIEPQDRPPVSSLGDVSDDSAMSRHQAVFWHTHDPEIGPDSEYHSHEVSIKFQLASDEKSPSDLVATVNNMHEGLQGVVETFFDQENDFSGVTIESAGQRLFGAVIEALPELHKGTDAAAPYLKAVLIAIDYDGSLDHPTQRMEFMRTLE